MALIKKLSLGAALFICGISAQAAIVSVDISGVTSNELQGDPLNQIVNVDLATALGGSAGQDVNLDGVGWDLILTTFSPSWADEPRFAIYDSTSTLIYTAGPFGSATTVSSANFVQGVVPGSIGPVLLSGGTISIEFYETGFNDFVGAPDAQYLNGSRIDLSASLVAQVSEPGILVLFGLGLIGMVAGRRRLRA